MANRAAHGLVRFLLLLTLLGVMVLGDPFLWSGPFKVSAQSLPPNAYVYGVNGRPQSYNLSCESRSAVDWAAFFGTSISETEFLNRLGHSDNPDLGFVGSANGLWGGIPPAAYGVHAGPVAEVLRQYGVSAAAKSGMTWDEVRAEIAAGRPVIVWVIGAMWGGSSVEYHASNGQSVRVAPFEHTMVLVGYDLNLVYALDSGNGLTQGFYINNFLSSWGVLGNMAVIQRQKGPVAEQPSPQPQPAPQPQPGPRAYGKFHVYMPMITSPGEPLPPQKPNPAPNPTPDPVPATYQVQKGDHLLGIARKFNLEWQEIARLNNLWYPFVLYPSQVLRLR